jgi:hypothetical protein
MKVVKRIPTRKHYVLFHPNSPYSLKVEGKSKYNRKQKYKKNNELD